jgi:hypothetical protein
VVLKDDQTSCLAVRDELAPVIMTHTCVKDSEKPKQWKMEIEDVLESNVE